MVEYLGTYHGALLLKKGRAYFQQSEDGALGPKWREFRITRKAAHDIMAVQRTRSDMVFETNDSTIPPVVDLPLWRTYPRKYLDWHRDNDPPPWSERAAAALAALDEA